MTLSKKPVYLSAILAAASGGALFFSTRQAQGAGDDTPKAVATVKDIMFAVNAGDDSLVGRLKADFDKEKLDEDGWEAAKGRASMIMEAGNLLYALKPSKGDEAAWKKHVADYRGCAQEARNAAIKMDAAAGKAALAGLKKRCAECHKEHRGE